jgi:hypothetical protein
VKAFWSAFFSEMLATGLRRQQAVYKLETIAGVVRPVSISSAQDAMKAAHQTEAEPNVAFGRERSLMQRTGSEESGRLTRLFLMSAGWIFLLTAVIKFMSAMQEARVLGRPDPLLEFLTTRQLLALTALLEAGVAVVILWAGRAVAGSEKLLLVLWLAMMFLLYRLGLWWIGHQGGCNCMGNAAQWLGASPATLDIAAKVLLAYLLLGSFALLTARSLMQFFAKRLP